MRAERSPSDPRDVDAEFARMLEGEGMDFRPGAAPCEPAAPASPASPADWDLGPDSPADPPTDEDRARARAAHPALGGPDPAGSGVRGGAGPRELDDDEVLYGDFEPPDPDLPAPTSGVLWSWTALLGGFALLLVSALSVQVPSLLGGIGAAAAVGGLVSLLLRAPRSRDEDDDGAEV